jgi:hypothetical protein
MSKLPVLIITFNKENETKLVFSQIRLYKPEKLFIASDGPRSSVLKEYDICTRIRKWVLGSVDWDCQVETQFNELNLGCGRNPVKAIDWFFDHVDKGIILEDDCLPGLSFFNFCEINIEKYERNPDFSIVSGNNFQIRQPMDLNYDYYFSVFPSTWGWATWKRVWEGYQFVIPKWNQAEEKELKEFLFTETKYSQWWINQLHWMQKTKPEDMWDFQLYFHCMKRKQLAIIPKANLVSNIGFGELATHTTDRESYFSNLPVYDLDFPLRHPDRIERNYEADLYVQKILFGEIEPVSRFRQLKRYLKRNLFNGKS